MRQSPHRDLYSLEMREMILQFREPSFRDADVLFKASELNAGSGIGLATVDIYEEYR
jgi:hypothetical protein